MLRPARSPRARYYADGGGPTADAMRRCLIIEDDTENARYVAGLRELGWGVAVGRRARRHRASTRKSWDLIVLDRMLPNDVDGLSILRTLRALGTARPRRRPERTCCHR